MRRNGQCKSISRTEFVRFKDSACSRGPQAVGESSVEVLHGTTPVMLDLLTAYDSGYVLFRGNRMKFGILECSCFLFSASISLTFGRAGKFLSRSIGRLCKDLLSSAGQQ